MSNILLSIAIPSIPSRMRMNLQPLFSRLMAQVGDRKDVEIVSILDNKSMTIGRKRQLLHRIAQGRYTAIIDDDDDVTPDYVEEVTKAISEHDGVDVICYDQEAIIEGTSFLISTDIRHPMNPFDQLPHSPKDSSGNFIPCRRPPWHWCAWRTDFAQRFEFADTSCGEDGVFVDRAMAEVKTQHKINKPLHIYRWSAKTTAAPFIAPNA
jgi:hypothetical protein